MKILNKIKQLFCKHDYREVTENKSSFSNLTGERVFIVCKKCGKVKGSYFREYEGMGYK